MESIFDLVWLSSREHLQQFQEVRAANPGTAPFSEVVTVFLKAFLSSRLTLESIFLFTFPAVR